MTTSLRPIVCATDFSANARQAADVAAAIAVRLRSPLVLVHVADEAHALREGTREFREFMRPAAAALRQEAKRLRSTGASVEATMLHGSWAENAIVGFVEKSTPAMVVVSSVSKTTFDRWTLGSVSERISQQSPIPTLVVRFPDRLIAWARQERPLNIVVGADFSASSEAALAYVRELRRIGPCAVQAIHIDVESGAAAGSQVTRDLRRRLRGVLDEQVDVRVDSNPAGADVALVHRAAEKDADLIVVGTHPGRVWLRLTHASIARNVVRHAPMSVLCVPFSGEAVLEIGQRPRVRRVLAATDFSASGNQAVSWAYASLGPGGTVHLVHVLPPRKSSGRLSRRPKANATTAGAGERRMNEAHDKLEALMPATATSDGVLTEIEVIEDRDPARAIGVVAKRCRADLICLGTRGHTALAEAVLGSVARTVAARNPQPVLVVRSG